MLDVMTYLIWMIWFIGESVPDHIDRENTMPLGVGQDIALIGLQMTCGTMDEDNRLTLTTRFQHPSPNGTDLLKANGERSVRQLRPKRHSLPPTNILDWRLY